MLQTFIQQTKTALGAPPLTVADDVSKIVLDRNGQLLRAFTAQDGRWRMPVKKDAIEPRYFDLLLAYEDNRFYQHGGVDGAAVIRAVGQLIWHGRPVSGASTLTMQTARLLDRRHERSIIGKMRQAVRALQLEELLSKRQILELYLRLAPFGGNIEGVRAASLAYFGKEPKRLSLGEAALLVALPQSPEARRPDRHAKRARRARNRVLDRAARAGVITAGEAARAKRERVPTRRLEFPLLAPHLAEREVALNPQQAVHRLTLDAGMQGRMQRIAKRSAERLGRLLGPGLTAAVMVVDSETGEVLARVGASDYLDQTRHGAVDMTRAVRSPGSTLKPFIYGMAFDAGLAHPETLINDARTRFGVYRPRNFNAGYRGLVTMREALAASLNVPAVKLLEALRPEALAGQLKLAGATSELPVGAKPSLAMALGGVGLRLSDLVALYAAVARGGDPVALSHKLDARQVGSQELGLRKGAVAEANQRRRPLLSLQASWYVTDILKDAPPPKHFRAGRIAFKTGTSYGYRDALAIGYDGKTVIGVWIGRADGASVPGLVGRTAAAPLLFDAFQQLGQPLVPFTAPPDGVILAGTHDAGGQLPVALKRFGRSQVTEAAGAFVDPPVAIAFPMDRSAVELGFAEGEQNAGALRFKAEGGRLPLTWLVNGAPIGGSSHRRETSWRPDAAGFAAITVIDAAGRSDHVKIRLR
ncbi:MAG: penicillin-binding protein 1C [Pseudomonadota bacterium]